ncbi:MAG TPA: substrate-binding domain-containing protein, partial [Trebonia sp.]|nr:substrate-binding domain-containing protein [Trebonia sp.]
MHLLPVLIPLVATFIGMVGAIFSVLGILRPGRIPRPRRMVHYRVHYDDSLGTRPDIKGVAELVVRRKGHDVPDASLAMIRISNEGGLDIAKEHWIMPISFTFDGRDVVGVEVSDADHVPRGLLTGDQEQAWRESRPSGGVLQATADAETIQISKGKKSLELPRVELKRRDRIRLLVLLSGPRDNLRPGVEGGALIKNAVRGGGLVREDTPLRAGFYTFGWTGFALVSLVAAILVTFIVRPFSTPAPVTSSCVPGTIVVAGSTAFAPSVVAVAQRLRQDCPSSIVQTNPGGSTIGSLGAASDLEDSGNSATVRATHLVISDGAVPAAEYPGLTGHPVAIVIFSVVVNHATGVASLTEAQLVDIWTGKYTNWRQLGGANLPIDIISRTTDSGTRATFDHKILRMTTEIPQSSQSCTSRDLIPNSPVIRCEKSSTDELLKTVNAIPGAIGYAEVHVAEQDEASMYPNVGVVQLGGRDASPEEVNAGPHSYPFWAVEYMYTDG